MVEQYKKCGFRKIKSFIITFTKWNGIREPTKFYKKAKGSTEI
jgi:hypothetical protein